MDRVTFDEYVRDALAHLYDHLYLQTHPLANLLTANPGDRARGQTVHRILMEAFESLRPPDNTPYRSLAWRKYRYLILRYVEEVPPGEIADELGTSDRQGRRDHIEALNAVASRLWDVYRDLWGLRRTEEREHRALTQNGGDDRGALIGDEVARLGSLPSSGPSSVHGAVEGALMTVAALARSRETVLYNAVPTEAPDLAISRTVLRQILLSTLLFALDHGHGGQITVVTEGTIHSFEIRILAKPAGSGPKRTSPLNRLDQRERLTAVQRLVGMHGGEVRIADAGEAGVQVTLRFPPAAPSAVVVIEDNPDMMRLLRRYLVAGGYRVVEANTAISAVECVQREHPVAITLDVMMPTQDGWEILQILKSHPQTRDVPVIVCSVLRERELALSLGASELLAKPVTQPELLDALARCQAVESSEGHQGQP